MSKDAVLNELLSAIKSPIFPHDGKSAFVGINGNEVLDSTLVPGLHIDSEELEDGIRARIYVEPGVTLEKPVHLCFGMVGETGVQRINLDIEIGDDATAQFMAHCVFPKAVDVQHIMDADIKVGARASYVYFERHIHGRDGGVTVKPTARVHVGEDARFSTEFELIRGRVGVMEIDYESSVEARGVLEMTARISGRGNDRIQIRESGDLLGEGARGVLTSHIALRDDAYGEVYNDLRARAPHARGHVDCKEIVQGRAVARAIPIVQVDDPRAHVTHEAAIGSVDSKQLQTLMSRGLSEDDATEMIIDGLLS
ncbi:MAG: SufD family Fe-S cluster assembly protein [Spirochaetia bacterium]